jgi:hypothetical protein
VSLYIGKKELNNLCIYSIKIFTEVKTCEQSRKCFDLILDVAKADQRIRAVYMNGSRANPNIKKDKYQDYDIVYVVTETESF